MESTAHRRLKHLALAFLHEQGCQAAALEVRCPIGRYRVDAAGYRDTVPPDLHLLPPLEYTVGRRLPRRRPVTRRCPPLTIVVECKQSRSDFLREHASVEALLAERRDLQGIARSIEEHRIRFEEPQLQQGDGMLFPELGEWDYSASQLPAYRKVLRRLRQLDERLYGQTKYCMIGRYRLADRLYLAAPRGMIARHELPADWGLLECSSAVLQEGREPEPAAALQVAVDATVLNVRSVHRDRLLRNIAVSATAAAWGHQLVRRTARHREVSDVRDRPPVRDQIPAPQENS